MSKVSENALDLINQGIALMSQEKFDAAREKFEKAISDSPQNYDAYIHLGNALSNLDEYDKAVDNFKKALLLDKNSSEALFNIGNVMYLKGNTLEAMQYYNKAEEKGNMTASMYDVMAGVFAVEKDPTQALRLLNKAIQLEPLNGQLYLEKVSIFMEQEQAKQALETLHELNRVLPDAYEAYDLLSEIYVEIKDFKKALEVVEKGVERFPEDPNLAYLKLKVLVSSEDDVAAFSFLEEMKKTGNYDKVAEQAVVLESTLYARKQDLNKVIECLEAVCNNTYTNKELAFLLINAYARTNGYDRIEKITKEMMQGEYDAFYTSSAQFYHAQALKQIGKTEESLKEFRELTKTLRRATINDTAFYEGYIYRLLAHKELKEFDKALELADYIGALFPERPDSHAFRYAIYKDMGDKENAEKEKALVKEIDPNFEV